MTQKTEHNYDVDIKREFNELKKNLNDLKDIYLTQASKAAHKVPEAIQEGEERLIEAVEIHPLSSIAIAAAVGFMMGAIFAKK